MKRRCSKYGRGGIGTGFPSALPCTRKRGFTLIELLVVIAIISLLVSILLPSLQKAKELTRRVICLTRVKAIGSSLYLYMNEFNGKGPIGFTYGGLRSYPYEGWSGYPKDAEGNEVNPYGAYYGWYRSKSSNNPDWALGEYLGVKSGDQMNNESVAKSRISCYCPNVEDRIRFCTAPTFYAVNAFYGVDTFLGDHVENPSITPMLMDGWNPVNDYMKYAAHPRHLWQDKSDPYSFNNLFVGLATYSHEGSGNFLFFDGHAENQEGPPASVPEDEEENWYMDDLGWYWYGW